MNNFSRHSNILTMITISLFYYYEKMLTLWIYGRLGKIQWDIVTWKIRFLYSLKYGRY